MEEDGMPADPFILMEQILDMLKLLDYENKFCKNKGFKPISKVYFAVAHSNPSEQFINFVSIVSWLLSINNHQVNGWNKYEDPMTASQNIITELSALGIELHMGPGKLKSGWGDGVCIALFHLCSMSIQNKFRFKRAAIRDDGGGMGDDGDDEFGGDEFEGHADVAELQQDKKGLDDSGDIDEDMDYGGIKEAQIEMDRDENEINRQEILQSLIGREEWMLEVERVAHKLKINKTATDGKEWRSHMEQTKKYHEQVKNSLPEVRAKLERLADDVTRALEKIAKKESVLTRNF